MIVKSAKQLLQEFVLGPGETVKLFFFFFNVI